VVLKVSQGAKVE